MLLNIGRNRYTPDTTRDTVHNYYEQMVFDQILRANDRANSDAEFMADVACVALNRLPPKYVRHDVDMTFFLTPNDMENMIQNVVEAVNQAIDYVVSREDENEEDADQE